MREHNPRMQEHNQRMREYNQRMRAQRAHRAQAAAAKGPVERALVADGGEEGRQHGHFLAELHLQALEERHLRGHLVLRARAREGRARVRARWRPAHAVLGESRLDLEDRWFHRKWQALDERSEANPGNPLKPIEVRRLTRDGSLVARGQLYAWVEIRKDAAARRDPPVALEGPERREFEVRVVVWASKDVPFEMGDYYVQAPVGNCHLYGT